MLIRLLKLLVLSACLLPGDCSDEHETSSTVAPDPVDPTFPSPTASPPSTGVNAINCAINEENETHVSSLLIIVFGTSTVIIMNSSIRLLPLELLTPPLCLITFLHQLMATNLPVYWYFSTIHGVLSALKLQLPTMH